MDTTSKPTDANSEKVINSKMFCGFNFTGAGGLTAAKKSFL